MKKLLLILLCLPMIGLGQSIIVQNTAKQELNDYLKKIPYGQEKNFGFNDRSEFSQSEIGMPYEVFTLANAFFNSKNVEINKNYLVSTGKWRVPVIVNNEHRVLLTVSKINNKWSIVKIGGKGLANELEKFKNNNPSITSLNILRVFQLKGDFVLTSQDTVYPLTSGSNSLNIDSEKPYSVYEILKLIKDI